MSILKFRGRRIEEFNESEDMGNQTRPRGPWMGAHIFINGSGGETFVFGINLTFSF
jgi:hypothetical protein